MCSRGADPSEFTPLWTPDNQSPAIPLEVQRDSTSCSLKQEALSYTFSPVWIESYNPFVKEKGADTGRKVSRNEGKTSGKKDDPATDIDASSDNLAISEVEETDGTPTDATDYEYYAHSVEPDESELARLLPLLSNNAKTCPKYPWDKFPPLVPMPKESQDNLISPRAVERGPISWWNKINKHLLTTKETSSDRFGEERAEVSSVSESPSGDYIIFEDGEPQDTLFDTHDQDLENDMRSVDSTTSSPGLHARHHDHGTYESSEFLQFMPSSIKAQDQPNIPRAVASDSNTWWKGSIEPCVSVEATLDDLERAELSSVAESFPEDVSVLAEEEDLMDIPTGTTNGCSEDIVETSSMKSPSMVKTVPVCCDIQAVDDSLIPRSEPDLKEHRRRTIEESLQNALVHVQSDIKQEKPEWKETPLHRPSGSNKKKRVHWERPSWVKFTLKPTGKAQILKKTGNLASPISRKNGEGDTNQDQTPQTDQEKKKIEWEKPAWAGDHVAAILKSTGRGKALRSGLEFATVSYQ
jgi:hypothetical protein